VTHLHVVGNKETEPLNAFLDHIYGEQEGYSYSPTKDPNNEDQVSSWTQHFFSWPDERDQLLSHILTESTDNNVYISPALFKTRNATKAEFASSNCVWAEFDGSIPSAEDLSRNYIPPPTLKIRSSTNDREHWYWRTKNVFTSGNEVESLNRRLTYLLHADASGWDCSQVLRPPNTFNFKRSAPVTLLENTQSWAVFNLETIPPLGISEEVYEPTSIPDISKVGLRYPFTEQASSLFLSPHRPVGERSSSLMQLGFFGAEMGMSNDEIYALLLNADERWGKFRGRTDQSRRLSEIVTRARLKHPSNQSNVLATQGLLTFLRSEIKIEWMIQGLLEAHGAMLLTGPSGVGKTQFTLNCAIALALGRPFLNFSIQRPTKVLFASLEMAAPSLKYFLQQITAQLTQEELLVLEENLFILPLGESLPLTKEHGQRQFETVLADCGAEGYIIDSLGSTASSLSDEQVALDLMNWNEQLRNRRKVFSWFIHHQRKADGSGRKPNKLEDVYGSHYFTARSTSVYCLWPSTTNPTTSIDTIEVIPLKKRLAGKENPWYIRRNSNLNFAVTTEANLVNPGLMVMGGKDREEPVGPDVPTAE
jgi:KaiC/GvpD/RAD55 family RecA-like ATPase